MTEDQCKAEHNPGTWPYAARCIRKKHDGRLHVDRKGREWLEKGLSAAEVWADSDADDLREVVRTLWKDLAEALDAETMAASFDDSKRKETGK